MADFPPSRGHDELGGPDRFVSGRLHLLHCSFFQHLIVKRSEDLWLWIWGSMDFRSMDLRWFEDLRFLQVAYSYKAPHTKHLNAKWAPTGNTWPLIKVSSGCYGYPPIKQSINESVNQSIIHPSSINHPPIINHQPSIIILNRHSHSLTFPFELEKASSLHQKLIENLRRKCLLTTSSNL